MRAASHGIPFEPIVGLTGSDIPAAAGFKTVVDPYTGVEVYAIQAIRPDWAILHVQEADALGNARICKLPRRERRGFGGRPRGPASAFPPAASGGVPSGGFMARPTGTW